MRYQSRLIGFMVLSFGILLFMNHLLYPSAIDAQSARNSQWTDFEQEDGLISNDVWSILKDEQTIWFGTGAGISRFDGAWHAYPAQTNFDSSQADENQQLFADQVPPGRVLSMTRTETDGAIWVGTDQGHIARWDDGRWAYIITLTDGSGAGASIQALQFINSELWIGTKSGLWTLTPSSTTNLSLTDISPIGAIGKQAVYAITHQRIDDSDIIWVGTEGGLWRKQNQRWASVSADEGLQSASVYAIWIDSQNTIWIGSETGAAHRNPETRTWERFPTNDQRGTPTRVQVLAGDASGSIWAGTDGGGARKFIDGGLATLEFSTNTEDFKTDLIRDVAIDQDGSLWFGTPNGVVRYQERSWWTDQSGSDAPDRFNHVNDLLIDQQGAMWIATGGAGVRLKRAIDMPEESFTTEDGLPGNSILALAQDDDGGIWAAGFDGVARFIDGIWTTPLQINQLPSSVVTDIFVAGESIWLGTEGGLVQFHLQTGVIDSIPDLNGSVIQALSMDTMGRLWVMTQNEGIWVNSATVDDEWQQFAFDAADPSSFPVNSIQTGDLAPDPKIDGGMWLAVRGSGLIHWDGERWQDGDPENELPNDLLHKLFTDPIDGSLWVGSESGISRFDGITWGTFDRDDGLQTLQVFAVAQTEDGNYWFGGNTGLSYYQPEKTAPWIQIESLSGPANWLGDGLIQATLEQNNDDGEILLNLRAGDLQTPEEKLRIYYRLSNNGPSQTAQNSSSGETIDTNLWQKATNPLVLPVAQQGEYQLELWARDPAFNYSSILRQSIQVVPSPVVINIPFIGTVAQEGFQTIAILGGVILLLVGYVSFDMVRGRRRAVGAVNRSYNPYISGEPVRREDMFFGRHDLLQRIVDTLHNNSIMIHGERRIGKTTLLYQLSNKLREIEDPDYWFAPIYIDLEGTTQEEFFHFFIEEIVAGLSALPNAEEDLLPAFEKLRYHDTANESYTDREFNRDLHRVIRMLRKYVEIHQPDKQLRLILLLDEMDVMSHYDHLIQQQLRRIFMRDFAATVGAVVAGIQISKEWDRVESPWYNLFNEIEVEPFTKEMATELLVEPVRSYYQYDSAAIERIIDYSDGRPFRVQQYGLASVSNMLADGRRRIKLEDVEVAHLSIQNTNNHSNAGLPA